MSPTATDTQVKLTINGTLVSATRGETVLAAARRASCGPMVIVAVVHCAASGQRSSPAGRAEPCAARD